MPVGDFSFSEMPPEIKGQERAKEQQKEKGMSNSPVGKQIIGRIKPCGGQEINIRHTVAQDTQQHGFSSQLFSCHGFSYTGTEGDMGDAVQFFFSFPV